MSWNPTEELRKIGAREYDGYIWYMIKILRPKLPRPLPSWEDLYQDFVIYAIEAVNDYDATREVAAFTTYLYRHLQIRSYQYLNGSWLVMNQPKEKCVIPFSWFDSRREEGSDSYDPTRVEDHKDLMLEIDELKQRLSPRNAQLLDYFIDLVKLDEIHGISRTVKAFESYGYRKKISDLTGLEKHEVENFFMEVVTKARDIVEIS